MQSIVFTVPGRPQGKARARTFYSKQMGRSMSVTPDQTVLYENLVKERFLVQCQGRYFESDIPVTLQITAKFLPPKSTSKRKREQMLSGVILPLKKPDMDNIVKVVADALNGAAYHDDTQIAFIQARKVYSEMEGLEITVEEYEDGK